MITPEHIQSNIKYFQENDIENDNDYQLLMQQKHVMEQKLMERNYYHKNFQLLYSLVEKSRNYQEFVDILVNNKTLLKEIFTLEGQLRRSHHLINSDNVEIDWLHKFGIDIMEYIVKDPKLFSLYNNGLL
ncbi:hypothetical protein TPHA_0M01960 [Tetrapisispora phaffii CBS 4417]|uniref:Uncharacterized protein n=1 Tax=Tetrapisispora phaffii (strain ATCC 24235 / CBS 4417 / NBRC 1672 / NRRL Y-8282 / UCD 70-5) TaxID=1071381 RepID=G8C0Q6_TETPH|nr:hypothetical protein TPHA_0M01960 [Tetrapisispora phaffii CBS 4417]CCE65771.1 hypothetical protein TPHA_0M01960 [Tetrapisispora phaffii CBS 4417]